MLDEMSPTASGVLVISLHRSSALFSQGPDPSTN